MNGKINNICQIAYLRRYVLSGGQEDGIKVIEINTGKIRFMLNESKALDVMQTWHGNDNISFVSKNGFTKRELPFLNRFEGGMVYTCGLDQVGGSPNVLHGTFHNIPANVLRAEIDGEDIIVKAQIHFSALFGQELNVIRTVSTKIGSDKFTINDELENRTYSDVEYCLLYHVNLGYPMLDEGTLIDINVNKVYARTDWANKRMGDRTVFSDAVDCEFERCYFVDTKDGYASLTNTKLNKKFTLTYSKDTLPCFVQWCSGGSGDYALGFEPTTTYLDETYKTSVIKKGEKINFSITLQVTDL